MSVGMIIVAVMTFMALAWATAAYFMFRKPKRKLEDVRVLRIQWRAAGRFNNPSTRVTYTVQGSGDVVTRDIYGVNLTEHDIRFIFGWPYYKVALPEIEAAKGGDDHE